MKTETNKSIEWYTDAFRNFESGLNGQAGSSVHALRKAALEKFRQFGFPTIKNEEWKYTNSQPAVKINYLQAGLHHNKADKLSFDVLELVNKMEANLVVFVNGYFNENLSDIKENSKIVIKSLAKAINEDKMIVDKHLGRYSKIDNGFNALNTAFLQDGIFIHVNKGQVIEKPVYILYLGGDEKDNLVIYPRNLIIADENSQVTIIENYSGSDNSKPYLNNVVTEVYAGENSNIDIYKIQQERYDSYHVSKTQAQVERNATFSHTLISTGGLLVRNDLNAVLDGEGITTHYNGLYVVGSEQHIDNHTLADHAKPHCVSNETYKGILGGRSRGVFNGKIIVRPDAQKTNAYQSNKNVILSKEALMNTKPQLEIFADDVRCTHGATVGQIEEEQVFYLRSRGINEVNARNLLIQAFAEDVVDMIKLQPLREFTSISVFEHLNTNIQH